MKESSMGCFLSTLLITLTIALSIGSGFLAWEWTKPDSFWSAMVFLFIWAILSKVGHYLGSLIIIGIGSLFE